MQIVTQSHTNVQKDKMTKSSHFISKESKRHKYFAKTIFSGHYLYHTSVTE